ncbi:MAG: cytochrome P450 [Alphaproteobacteria bacterium]|nr:cytochrome P450 [Alphaproteobacteria bacterium]
MHRTERRFDIAAPAPLVWDLLADFDRYPDWNPYLPEAVGRFAAGEVVQMRVRLGDAVWHVKQRIVDLQPGRSWAWSSHSWYTVFATGGTRRFTLEPRGPEACTLVDEEVVEGPLTDWVQRWFGPAMSSGMEASGLALQRYAERLHAEGSTAPGPHPPPPTVGGPKGLGVRGAVRTLTRIMFDPIQMIDDHRAAHGDLFTLPVPFGITPPFTFLTTREGYDSVLRLDPEVGRNGPVIDRVPAMARWTPRSDPSDAHLQELLLAGRRHIATQVRGRTPDALDAAIRSAFDRHVDRWSARVDLATELVAALHDTSARLLLGDALCDALGPETAADLRVIVNAVDAARAATALSPAARLLPEYAATRRLGRRLLALARDPDADRFPYVAAARALRLYDRPLPPEDVAWMVFFALWNATLYVGTYGVWAYLDLLDHPDALARVRAAGPERADLLTGAVVETMRRNPISWQLRSLAAPVQVTCDGAVHTVPAGHFLSVFSHGLNRDPAVYPDPLAWRPERYLEGAPAPLLFGTGPFSCVAQHWVKRLLATCLGVLVDRVDATLERPLPERVSRVHLLYPSRSVWASVRPRAVKAAA